MQHPCYRFDDCLIDPRARELHVRGELQTLSPKVFDCLVYLLEHRERAVGRDELIAAVWGRVDVSDTLLGQTILKARRALGDAGREQRAIRTVPRFGYRWVAEVTVLQPPQEAAAEAEAEAGALPVPDLVPAAPASATGGEAAPAAAGASAATPPAPAAPRRRGTAWLVAGVLAALALALLAWQGRGWLRGPAMESASPPAAGAPVGAAAILVLPADVEAGADWTWLRLGLMDLLAGRLRDAGLAVVPSENVLALLADGGGADPAAVTGAAHVVRPEASRVADGWRVRLRVDSDGEEHWVEARDEDAITAARLAADELLARLGVAVDAGEGALPLPAETLLSRVESAVLTDDLVTARRLLESAPAAVRELPEARLRLAQIEYRAGAFDVARDRLGQLLAELPAEERPVLRARVLNAAGAVAVRQGRFDDARRAFEEAVALLDERRQPAALGQALTGLAVARAAAGEDATAAFARARVALELAGDRLALARVEANEAVDAARRGRYAQVVALQEHAAREFERFGARNERVATLGNLAAAQLDLLEPAAALATTEAALAAARRLESPASRAELGLTRAAALRVLGRFAAAGEVLEGIRSGHPEATPSVALRSAHEAAALALAEGHAEQALGFLQELQRQFPAEDDPRLRAADWLLRSRILRATGREHEVEALLAAWAPEAGAADRPPARAYLALARAEHAWAGGDFEAAESHFAEALAAARAFEVPADVAEVADAWGTRLVRAGRLDAASPLVGLAARWAATDHACALLQLRYYHALGEVGAWRTALANVQTLAGERPVPAELLQPPPERAETAPVP